jgi:DNA repair protein RecO
MILLFSQKYGKISVGTSINEKGRNKSALALRPFTYGKYDLFKNRDSFNLNNASVLKSYYKIGEDVDKYMNSSYILEFTEKVLQEGQPSQGMFNLIIDYLDVIENRQKSHETVVLGYQVKTLKIMGVLPELNYCIDCGEPISKENPPIELTMPRVKVRYLKTKRMARLTATVSTRMLFEDFSFLFRQSIQRASAQLIRMEPIITKTNQGSPQA